MTGILFTPDNHKAIRDLLKTETRRLMKPQPFMHNGVLRWQPKKGIDINITDHPDLAIPFAKYHVGEIYYIKETWWSESGDLYYKSDWGNDLPVNMFYAGMRDGKWRSPLFMPAWAARDFIKMLNIFPQQAQDITPAQAIAEGFATPEAWGAEIDRLNPKKKPWDNNLFLWAYTYKLIKKDGRDLK